MKDQPTIAQDKIKWAEEQLTPVERKDLKGEKVLFKLIPANGKKDISDNSIAVLIRKSRQNVHLQR